MEPNIVFFDGVCGLCNRFVNFLLRRDIKKILLFSTLQGSYIQQTKARDFRCKNTILFLSKGKIYTKSTAVIKSVACIGGLWKSVIICYICPKWIRDKVYDFVASHRYQWFGKKERCRLPLPEEKSRFLE